MSALLWLPMRSQYVDPGSGLMVTENMGSLGGTVQCGDGATAGTFPTQRSPRGASFDGGDYLQWLSPVANGTYSIIAFVQKMETGAAGRYILDARAGGGTGFFWDSGAGLASSSGTIYVDGLASTTLAYGQTAAVACSGITLAAPASLSAFIDNTIANGWLGSAWGLGLFPDTLTPTQVRDLSDRMRVEANV